MRRWWEKVLANTKTQKQKPGVGTLGSVVEHFPASARPRVPSPEWGGRRAEAGSEWTRMATRVSVGQELQQARSRGGCYN